MREDEQKSVTQRVDMAIIGGGLVGASLGCALAGLIEQHGLSVAVIEAAPLSTPTEPTPTDASGQGGQPSFDARASAIALGSAQHFMNLGLWSAMVEQATPIHCIHISERGRLGAARLRARDLDQQAMGYVIPNAWMGQVLHRRLAELPLDWHCPARVEGIQPIAAGHLLTLSDGSCLEAGLTVLADGGRSGLKEKLGIHSQERDYDQVALITIVEVSRPHEGIAYERFTDEGPIALLPMSGQTMVLIWTHEQGREQHRMALSDGDFLEQLQLAFGDRAGRFRRVGQRYAYPLSLITAEETVRPGLAVLGNAAHALHPVAGQGFNLALRGVMDLVAALSQGLEQAHGLEQGKSLGNIATLLDFEARRDADREGVIRFSDGLIRLFGVEGAMLSHARAAGLVGFNLTGPLRHGLARRAMGVLR